jgi:hypothetical protein
VTAPAIVHTPPRIPFLARYKPGHELEGMHVERGRFCDNCRTRFFNQQVINADYYNQGLRPESRRFFLQSCELEKVGRAIVAWFPKFCHRCVRRTL